MSENEYPLFPEQRVRLSTEEKESMDKHRALRLAHPGRCLIVVAALVLIGAAVLFFIKFTVRILADDGKIGLSVSGKGETLRSDRNVTLETSPTGEKMAQSAPSARDDGSRMHITEPRYYGETGSLSDVYARVAPSVVCIEASGAGKNVTGSGVVMSETGYIITNCHIVSGAERIRVLLCGEEYEGVQVGGDAVTDLAVIKIEKSGCPYAEFADSDEIRVGETVAAIGNPLGASLPGTMTDGIVCAISSNVTLNGHAATLIQTNAALYAGSSGGPLVNMSGQVIGINTINTVALAEDVSGLGFALPSNFVKPIVDELIENGYISGRPSLGIVAVDYNLPAQAVLFYGTPGGVLVSSVYGGSQAESRGIRAGDIIVTVGGTDVYSVSDLTKVISSHQVGDTVQIVIFRSGRYYQADLDVVDEADFKR